MPIDIRCNQSNLVRLYYFNSARVERLMLAECDSAWQNLISPVQEIAAYEYLWTQYPSVPKLAKLFSAFDHQLPSAIAQVQNASPGMIEAIQCKIADLLPFRCFSTLFYGGLEYPKGREKPSRNSLLSGQLRPAFF